MKPGFEAVLIARGPSHQAEYENLAKAVENVLSRASLISNTNE